MKIRSLNLLIFFFFLTFVYGCSSSEPKDEDDKKKDKTIESPSESIARENIFKVAEEEQKNEMYSKTKDSTFVYYLDNRLLILNNRSKCNIFALNTIYKAGYLCPPDYVLTYDLMDTAKYNDIIPYIGQGKPEDMKPGDLIIWNGHIIIFDSLIVLKNDYFARAWWAGTKQEDNGENIKNNVIFGKYPLNGDYIVRRPKLRK